MSRPPTLETVAERAGVSRATVSRVVNGDARVADRLRVAVEEAVRQLGFVPNHAARSLATRRTGSVALVVSGDDPLPALGTIRDALAAADLQLVVLAAGGDANASVTAYARHHVDGVLLLTEDEELATRLNEWQLPLVLAGSTRHPLSDVTSVDLDNVGGGRLAARRLLDGGRRQLGIVAGPVDHLASADREAGFRQVANPRQLVRGERTAASGEQAVGALLTAAPELDGVFVADDLTALGALRGLAVAGRRVPDDVAVVGFGDLEVAAYSTPSLTTIRAPRAPQAERMVELLLRRMAGTDVPARIVLDVQLVARESA
jgi:DNA-binding LacI/PurR family transcriptional regulator